MKYLVYKLIKFQNNFFELIGQVVSWAIIVITFLLLYEVIFRYGFDSPTSWAHGLSTMIYGGYCMLLISYTEKRDSHVRCSVFYDLFSEKTKLVIDIVIRILGILILIIFFKEAFKFAAESWIASERSYNSTWNPIVYPFKTLMPIGIGLMILQVLTKLLQDIYRLCSRDFFWKNKSN